MEKKQDFIRQAEQNVLNHAQFMHDALRLLDNIGYQISSSLQRYPSSREKFCKGFDMMRDAVAIELAYSMSDCLSIVGIGGEKALAYSRERAKEMFGDKNKAVLQWLDENHAMAVALDEKAENEFRQELDVALQKSVTVAKKTQKQKRGERATQYKRIMCPRCRRRRIGYVTGTCKPVAVCKECLDAWSKDGEP